MRNSQILTKLGCVLIASSLLLSSCGFQKSPEVSVENSKDKLSDEVSVKAEVLSKESLAKKEEAYKKKLEEFRQGRLALLQKLKGVSPEESREALRLYMKEHGESYLQVSREYAEWKQSQRSPEDIAKKERQRVEMERIITEHKGSDRQTRQLAVFEYHLKQQDLSEDEIQERLERRRDALNTASSRSIEPLTQAKRERQRELQNLIEQTRDADPTERRQLIEQWKKRQQ